jgi:tRNA (cmo5U34)-methyltransferase
MTNVGDKISANRGDWKFSGDMVTHFVDHARKSIPFYDEGHKVVCRLSDYFITPGSVAYELGCSTGELTTLLAQYHCHKSDVTIMGIDSQHDMIDYAKEKHSVAGLGFEQGDAVHYPYKPASFIVSYYCIQFIPPKDRQALFDHIYESLDWGGCFVVFDKVRAPDARFQDMMTGLYHDFKTENGFSDAEILEKARSLRGIQEPYSSEENRRYFERAGFKDVMSVFKYLSFEGFIGIK